MNGFIKLSRSLLKWEWHDDPNMVALWVYILMRANWEDIKWHGMDIPKGSFITSLKSISKDTGIPIQSVRTCLDRLESTHSISRKSTNKNTQIFVEKWADYQCYEDIANKQLTNSQQTTNKQLTTDKEEIRRIKKNKKYIEPYPSYDSSLNGEVDTSELDEYLKAKA